MPEQIQQIQELNQQLQDRLQLVENLLFAFIKSDQYLFMKAITLADGVNIALDTGTGTKIGTSTSQKMSLWNATPVAQQTAPGVTTVSTAGVGTAFRFDSASSGGTGTVNYTFGDIVLALKNFGLIAS